ncbi:MAG: DoxX family protein [Rubrobacteraceae bacterium]
MDPESGWISPFFVDQITGRLGMSVETFLQFQGYFEIILGLLLIAGFFTPVIAVVVGLMFWSFAVANPVAGEIRLSRDVALAGLCFALVVAGPGRWSVDNAIRGGASWFSERRDAVLVVVRLSLAFTLLASALFTGGVMASHLNETLPMFVVFALGLLFAAGVAPRFAAAAFVLWMGVVIPLEIVGEGLLGGLDSIKREIGLLAGAIVYTLTGSDRFAIFRPLEPRSKSRD